MPFVSIDGLAKATKSVFEEKICLLETKYAKVFFRTAGKVFDDQSVNSVTESAAERKKNFGFPWLN